MLENPNHSEPPGVGQMGRTRDNAYARYRAGEITEMDFIATAVEAMKGEPDAFFDWLDGYTMVRYGEKRWG